MKIVTILALSMVPVLSQSASTEDDIARAMNERAKQIEEARKLLSSPTISQAEKAALAEYEMQLLDQDTDIINRRAGADEKQIAALEAIVLETQSLLKDQLASKASGTNAAPASSSPPANSHPGKVTAPFSPTADSNGLTAGAVQTNVTRQHGSMVEFGWMVPISNNTGHDATNVSVSIFGRDRNDVEVANFLLNGNVIPNGTTINVTNSTATNVFNWSQIDHWVVKIDDLSPSR